MAVVIKHKFQSAKADNPADVTAGNLTPSKWNEEHDVEGLDTIISNGLITYENYSVWDGSAFDTETQAWIDAKLAEGYQQWQLVLRIAGASTDYLTGNGITTHASIDSGALDGAIEGDSVQVNIALAQASLEAPGTLSGDDINMSVSLALGSLVADGELAADPITINTTLDTALLVGSLPANYITASVNIGTAELASVGVLGGDSVTVNVSVGEGGLSLVGPVTGDGITANMSIGDAALIGTLAGDGITAAVVMDTGELAVPTLPVSTITFNYILNDPPTSTITITSTGV